MKVVKTFGVNLSSCLWKTQVRMAADGTVSEVKVAHTGDPEARDRGFVWFLVENNFGQFK